MAVEAVVLAHNGKRLHVLQRLRDLLVREGTEGAGLDEAHLLALRPQLVHGLLHFRLVPFYQLSGDFAVAAKNCVAGVAKICAILLVEMCVLYLAI